MNPLVDPLANPLANMLINMSHKGNGFANRYIYMFVNGLVTLERALEASRREAPGPGLAGGSAATQPRLRLFAKCAFEQRFLSKFTRKAWERQALRGGAAPSGGTAHAGRDGRLPFTPYAVSSSALAESATNPKMPLATLTAPALRRAFLLGVGRGFHGKPRQRRLKQRGFAGAQPLFGPALGQSR